jgi:hypothetical protein
MPRVHIPLPEHERWEKERARLQAARARRAAQLRDEIVALMARPDIDSGSPDVWEDFDHLFHDIARSDLCLWPFEKQILASLPPGQHFEFRAMLADVIAPRLTRMKPGTVTRRDELVDLVKPKKRKEKPR